MTARNKMKTTETYYHFNKQYMKSNEIPNQDNHNLKGVFQKLVFRYVQRLTIMPNVYFMKLISVCFDD